MKKRIALLYGGADGEHDVSVMGYEYVSELLKNTSYEILPVYIGKDGAWKIHTEEGVCHVYPTSKAGGSLCTEHGFIRIDAAIPLLHGKGGEDGSVQGALEIAGIPYVGADVSASAICLDKTYAKAVAESIGIPTVPSISPRRYESTATALNEAKEKLGFPLFIKPRRLGSSVGAYPIHSEEDFLKYYPLAQKVGDGLVIIEKLLTDKRELECAFLEFDGKRTVTPPGEVLIDGFYGYSEKYSGKTHTVPTSAIDSAIAMTLIEYGERLADAMMLRHLGRIDFFLCGGKVFFNEINTFPGFTKESLYPKMLESYGVPPKDAILSFIEDALCGRAL